MIAADFVKSWPPAAEISADDDPIGLGKERHPDIIWSVRRKPVELVYNFNRFAFVPPAGSFS